MTDKKPEAKIHVNTTVVGTTLEQRMDLQIGEAMQHLSTQAIDLSEDGVYQALISLGWTPPSKQPAQQQVPSVIQMFGHCPECGAKARHFTSPQPAQQQEQKPFGYIKPGEGDYEKVFSWNRNERTGYTQEVYTSPQPSKPWVGLTEQERNDLEDYCEMIIGKAAFEAIEVKLKEKNA